MLGKKQPTRQMKPLVGCQSPEKVQGKGELLGSPLAGVVIKHVTGITLMATGKISQGSHV